MKVEFSKKAENQFSKLDIRIQEKIINSIEKFIKGERIDIKKLKGYQDLFRVRVGEYRFTLKKVNSDLWIVTYIGKRESFYE